MFLTQSDKLSYNGIVDNLDFVIEDCKNLLSQKCNFDYVHDFDLTVDVKDWVLPEDTGHFWQVIPIIFKGEPFPNIPKTMTQHMLLNLEIKPLLSVFSILRPHSKIDPHIDADDELVYNTRGVPISQRETSVIKYHLTLTENLGKCGLVVGGDQRILHKGDLNIFDETNTHWAYNSGPSRRTALITSYLKNQL